jgi:hypothetical protein
MGAIELLADRAQLTLLELTDGEAAPPVGRPDDGRVHELQHGALAEGVGDDLGSTPLLEEEPLEQVRGADHAAMAEREAEMGDAGVEVVAEALHDRRQLALVGGDEVVAEHGRECGRRGLVAPARPQRDLRPLALRGFAAEIAHPMDEAPLTERAREASLDGANQPRRPVGHGEQRVGQAAAFEILEERRTARGVLLRARRQVQQDLPAVLRDSPGAEHRFPRQPGVQALGHAVDEEVGDRELAEVPPRERLVLLPQPLGHLADGGPTQQARAAGVTKGRFDVPGAQPARVHLDGQLLQLRRPPGQPGAHPRDERLGPIGHLRHAVLDGALRRAQPPAPVAVAIAGARDGSALVVPAAHGLSHLGFQRFLDDLPDRELD